LGDQSRDGHSASGVLLGENKELGQSREEGFVIALSRVRTLF
jgi:hypothetical protein